MNEIISYVLKSVKFNIHINKYIKYAFISIIFFMLFWFLRTGHSLGDADSIAWNVEHGEKFVNMGEPLTHYAYYLVYNITKNFKFSGKDSIAFVNSIAGAIFMAWHAIPVLYSVLTTRKRK